MAQMSNNFPAQSGVPAPHGAEAALRPVNGQRRFGALRAIGALMLREMSTSYGKSPGGYLWAIAEPVGGIVLLTLIFSAGFQSPPVGTNFAIFYATGVLPFFAYLELSGKVSASVDYSKSLLTYPAVTFMDALIARIAVNTLTQIMVGGLILAVLMGMMETRTDLQFDGLMVALVMTVSFSVAVGTMNCFMFSAFPWWRHIWSIINRPLFLISGVFFIYDDIPAPYQEWLWYNPLIHIAGQMRKSFFPSYSGDYVSYVYFFGVSLGVTLIGLVLLIKYHRDLQYS